MTLKYRKTNKEGYRAADNEKPIGRPPFPALSPAAGAVIDRAAAELARRLDEGECPDCRTKFDPASREPLWVWCSECRRHWAGSELNELRAYLASRRLSKTLATAA